MADGVGVRLSPVRASAEQRSGEAMERRGREGESSSSSRRGFTSSAMEVTTLDSFKETEFPVWDKIGAVVRLSYGIGKPRKRIFRYMYVYIVKAVKESI